MLDVTFRNDTVAGCSAAILSALSTPSSGSALALRHDLAGLFSVPHTAVRVDSFTACDGTVTSLLATAVNADRRLLRARALAQRPRTASVTVRVELPTVGSIDAIVAALNRAAAGGGGLGVDCGGIECDGTTAHGSPYLLGASFLTALSLATGFPAHELAPVLAYATVGDPPATPTPSPGTFLTPGTAAAIAAVVTFAGTVALFVLGLMACRHLQSVYCMRVGDSAAAPAPGLVARDVQIIPTHAWAEPPPATATATATATLGSQDGSVTPPARHHHHPPVPLVLPLLTGAPTVPASSSVPLPVLVDSGAGHTAAHAAAPPDSTPTKPAAAGGGGGGGPLVDASKSALPRTGSFRFAASPLLAPAMKARAAMSVVPESDDSFHLGAAAALEAALAAHAAEVSATPDDIHLAAAAGTSGGTDAEASRIHTGTAV